MKKNNDLLAKDFDDIKIINIILYIIIGIMPFIIIPQTAQPYINGKVIFLYLASILLVLLIMIDKIRIEINIEEKIIIIFFFSLVISTIFSIDVITSVIGKTGWYSGIITYSMYILFFLVASIYIKFSNIAINFIGSLSVIMSIYTIIQFYKKDPLLILIFGESSGVDSYGTIGNRNYVGTYFVIFLIAMLSIYVIFNKKIFLIYSSILFAGLLTSLTRGCWVAFICVALFALILLRKKKMCLKRIVIVISIFTIIFLGINITSNGRIIGRTNELVEDIKDLSEESGSGRIRIWRMVLRTIEDKPLLGTGLDTLDNRLAISESDEFWDLASKVGIVDKAHNEFLEYWACGGIVTVLSYISLISVILYKLFKRREDDISKIFMLTIVGYIVQSFFNNSVIAVAPLYWILLGAAVKHYRDLDKAKAVQAIAD